MIIKNRKKKQITAHRELKSYFMKENLKESNERSIIILKLKMKEDPTKEFEICK